jgi:hypothetical protein
MHVRLQTAGRGLAKKLSGWVVHSMCIGLSKSESFQTAMCNRSSAAPTTQHTPVLPWEQAQDAARNRKKKINRCV